MELYSHSRYKGYLLFVEALEYEGDSLYEGVAQLNGTTIFTSKSLISGDKAESKLIQAIDAESDD
jgi:hypothetical protein